MQRIILIRHAESQSNLKNKVFKFDDIIQLSEKGRKQAEDLVEILEKPDRVILSKFIRTQQTAEPLLKKFNDVDAHIWFETHEFNPVSTDRIDENDTFENVMKMYDDYFQMRDPFYNDGVNAESFKEFVDRLLVALRKMQKLEGLNYIFVHGWVIKNIYNLLENFSNLDAEIIKDDFYQKVMDKFIEMDKSDFKTLNAGQRDITDLLKKFNNK